MKSSAPVSEGEVDGADLMPVPPEERAGLWGRLRGALGRTRERLGDRWSGLFSGASVLGETQFETIEESLLEADLGATLAAQLVDNLRAAARRGAVGDLATLHRALVDEIAGELALAPRPAPLTTAPAVHLLVGVNGAGKTTTAAKLARLEQNAGHRVLLAAADTFRAAAAEQLGLWAARLGAEFVRQAAGADPAAVVFDALQAARARGVSRVIVDTAGRLQTKEPLMAELAKIQRVIERQAGDWQRRTWLVLDGAVGQNALAQAREFQRATPLDGLIVSKLDGTARGGAIVALAREVRLPVMWTGIGESADDLVVFDPRRFASALLPGGSVGFQEDFG